MIRNVPRCHLGRTRRAEQMATSKGIRVARMNGGTTLRMAERKGSRSTPDTCNSIRSPFDEEIH